MEILKIKDDLIIAALYRKYKENAQVVTDSRLAVPGTMFFALKGEKANGNDFVPMALGKGCKVVVTDDARWKQTPCCVYVESVLRVLQLLAQYHRQQFHIPVMGITGSNGKTTTKELICAVLRTQFKVHATAGNFNNHIGVPLTLLSMPFDTEMAVVEMGANHPGEIAELCEWVQPTCGLITNVSKAHLEGFGNFEGVMRTKRALYAYVQKHKGVIFANVTEPNLMRMLTQLAVRKVLYAIDQPFVAASHHPGKWLKIRHACTGSVLASEPFLQATLMDTQGKTFPVNTQLVGTYNISNVTAAACVGQYFGISKTQIAAALAAYVPQNHRSQIMSTPCNTLWVDCYNANPTSMMAALQSFFGRSEAQKVVILGDMFELGEAALAEHQNIVRAIAGAKGVKCFTVGETFMQATAGCPSVQAFPTLELLMTHLQSHPLQGAFVMLKGSHAIGLERLIPLL